MRIGEDAVDLLRHLAVETPQPGFDVGDGNLHLHGGERAGDGRRDVADDDHQVGLFLLQDRLEGEQDLRHRRGDGARADFEIQVGLGDVQLVEEELRHFFVVMLAGVDQQRFDARRLLAARASAARSS